MPRLSRRDLLRLGGLTGLGLSLPALLEARARASSSSGSCGRAKQVILLFLHGGHPQQETFDPKPHGPAELRGEFGAIDTSVPGVQFCELLPRCAAIMDKLAVVRSLSHGNANHVQACLPAQTGHAHPPARQSAGDFPPSPTDFPPIGAVLDKLRPSTELPTWVRIGPLMRRSNGTVLHGQTPGFLGERHSSFAIDQELLAADVRIRAVEPTSDLTSVRLHARQDLLREFDSKRRILEQSAQAADLDAYYQRAVSLLASSATRRAFQLAEETPQTRERYGATEFGQRCLLARRLAEAGVPMINVSYCHTPAGSWDTHSQNFKSMKQSLGPTLDAAFSALVEDCDRRGLLDETLIVCTAEFGRTPKINNNAGRDHWPYVYSVAIAGAGVRRGTLYGASDNAAAYPTDLPHDPADFIATIYHLLGVPEETVIFDQASRPYPLVIGKPIRGILA